MKARRQDSGRFDTERKRESTLRLDELVFERTKFSRVMGFYFKRTNLPAVRHNDRVELDRLGGVGIHARLLRERAEHREFFGTMFAFLRISSYSR